MSLIDHLRTWRRRALRRLRRGWGALGKPFHRQAPRCDVDPLAHYEDQYRAISRKMEEIHESRAVKQARLQAARAQAVIDRRDFGVSTLDMDTRKRGSA